MQSSSTSSLLSIVLGLVAGLIGGSLVTFFGPQYLPFLQPEDPDQAVEEQTPQTDVRTVVEESSTTAVVEQAKPSVVSIVITKEVAVSNRNGFGSPFFYDPFLNEPAEGEETQEVEVGGGTGFVISGDGLILTNRHVVSEQGAQYTVVLDDDTSYEAEVVARDMFTDIAILRIEAEGLTPLPLADSDVLTEGQAVIAIGNTLGEYSNTVTKGIVSGLSRDLGAGYNGLIQTDAAINSGNSGGPLLNLDGEVVGINTAVDRSGEGIGFAIPINEAKVAITSVKEHGRIVRPGLGVRYVPIDEYIAEVNGLLYDYGAYIRGQGSQFGIVPGSAADKAGLQEGDIILEVDGTRVDTEHPLADIIKGYNVGDSVTLKVFRDGKELEIQATLEEFPKPENET